MESFFNQHKIWKQWNSSNRITEKFTDKRKTVEFVRFSRLNNIVCQLHGLLLTSCGMIWQTFQSDFLLCHQFTSTGEKEVLYSTRFFKKNNTLIKYSYLSYIVVLWIPNPQNIANASKIEMSQSVKYDPLSY